jgi:hypothetical protein
MSTHFQSASANHDKSLSSFHSSQATTNFIVSSNKLSSLCVVYFSIINLLLFHFFFYQIIHNHPIFHHLIKNNHKKCNNHWKRTLTKSRAFLLIFYLLLKIKQVFILKKSFFFYFFFVFCFKERSLSFSALTKTVDNSSADTYLRHKSNFRRWLLFKEKNFLGHPLAKPCRQSFVTIFFKLSADNFVCFQKIFTV